MKKNTNILLVAIISLIVVICVGCSSAYEDATTKELDDNAELETTTIIRFTRFSFSLLYSFIYRNGVEKKGIAVETIDYKEEPIKLSYDYIYGNPTETDEEVEELFFVILNGEMCITELEDGEKEYCHIKKSNINDNTTFEFYVHPHKLYSDKANEIMVCHIPIGKRSEQYGEGTRNKPNYGGIVFNRDVISTVDLTETIDDSVKDVVIDSFENVYGKTIEEMIASQEHEYINKQQMIFKTEEGYMYSSVPVIYANVSRVKECSYYTLLFCDGKLFNGFDGKCMLSWTTETDKTSHKSIDVSTLEKGSHEIYVISVDGLHNRIEYSDVYTIEVE